MHIPESQRGKLGARSLVCTFIGFTSQRKAYKLVHHPSRRFIESRDVVFNEGGPAPRFERITIEHNCAPNSATTGPNPLPRPPSLPPQPAPPQPQVPSQASQPIAPPIPPELPAPTVTTVRPKRNVCVPVRDDDPCYNVSSYKLRPRTAEHTSVARTDSASEPKTYAEAMARPDAAMWEAACEEERKSFEAMEVFKVVPRPDHKKVVGSKWVYCEKRGPNGSIQKYKARVVTQGFTQVEGIDFDETFAPVAKLSSLRAILALATKLDLEVHQMDVKSTYLNGELEEEIYMEPPPGFGIPEGMVLKLNKAVYGTKQGGRVWYKNVKAELESMGYTRTEADHAVFVCYRDGIISIIILYVDDFTLVCEDIEVILRDKEALKKAYNMTDLGKLTYILGIHVKRDRKAGRIELSQQRYIEEILERYGKANIRLINTPALTNEHLTKLTSPEIDVKSYQRALGAIMYPMLSTHPDIAYAVGALGRHAATPGEEHQRTLD